MCLLFHSLHLEAVHGHVARAGRAFPRYLALLCFATSMFWYASYSFKRTNKNKASSSVHFVLKLDAQNARVLPTLEISYIKLMQCSLYTFGLNVYCCLGDAGELACEEMCTRRARAISCDGLKIISSKQSKERKLRCQCEWCYHINFLCTNTVKLDNLNSVSSKSWIIQRISVIP